MSSKLFGSVLAQVAAGLLLAAQPAPGLAAGTTPLLLDRTIPLGDVRGRIDHLAFDAARHRLLVAELGNGSIGVIDVGDGRLVHRIAGLRAPQGIAYLADNDTVFVASAGDGTVRRYSGSDYAPLGAVRLGEDADNLRIDPRAKQVVIGYGQGAIAVLGPDGTKLAEVPLAGHPEAFQLDAQGRQIYVNVPEAHEIAVLDRDNGRQIARWSLPSAGGNFPMALDEAGARLLVVYRSPALLAVFAVQDGSVLARVPTCGDADDISLDPKRRRVYVSCGQGVVDVLQEDGRSYRALARIPTRPGARTSLFLPALDRLLVAAPDTGTAGAAVLVFRPVD
ncbi:conserved hypothetical protein [Methylobacterium sp. 4-46]|uniref:YncE family protein n=1 Tax=unclassified Methylobacterium TaxID=2615210 RepID=UPI000165CDE1|nr:MULTISPECIES: hypothetical protein [Methylobacterium]ACA20428.1 conserved hypothetical protein [Methylobacterium sp. 4-46]WFT79599.1 hypothetical protein QA634_31070 [Methylobacterium nodulans]